MASLSCNLYFLAIFLILNSLTCPCSNLEHRVEEEEATHHDVVTVHSLLQTHVCTSQSKESYPSTLKLVHSHGPCSPLKPKKRPTHAEILHHDHLRVNWLHDKVTRPNSQIPESKIPAQSGLPLGTGNYIVTVGYGTPNVSQSVVFDTGSDVSWIQCQPCVSSCYQQHDPLFDPTRSSTYANISCNSPSCSALRTPSVCSGPTCLYSVRYGDNSSTVGFFAQDTLTLSSDTIPNFQFGCGQKNSGLFGQAAGLLGLGRKQASLVSQTAQKYGGVFSYCLPATPSSTGFLTFGPAPDTMSNDVSFTPMLNNPNKPSFYFVDLMSISVANETLAIPPALFSTPGTLIDSGTVITRLPPTAYSTLRAAFRERMAQYPMAAPASILDTCYDLSRYQTARIPKMALSYRGATMDLDATGILYADNPSQVCLGFAPNGDDSDLVIVGNTQQRRLNVVYDVSKQMVGFGHGNC